MGPNGIPTLLTVPGLPPSVGPATRGSAPGRCGLDRRAAPPHLQRSVIPRPPLPAPRLKMLQTPLGDEAE
jgi:hypothetical protein